jgi:hypothetical protein
MDGTKRLESLLNRYDDFGCSLNLSTSKILYSCSFFVPLKIKKVIYIRLFSEMMQSCENVLRLVRIIQQKDEIDPWENIVSSKEDRKFFSDENIFRLRDLVNEFENNIDDFYNKILGITVAWDKAKDINAIPSLEGIPKAISAAINNITVETKGRKRFLWKIHNKIKHGSPIVNKSKKDRVVIYINNNDPASIPTTRKDAKGWLETIQAMRNTNQNLIKITLSILHTFPTNQQNIPNQIS